MDITIHNEEANDIEHMRKIVRAAFPTDAESKLVDALRANSRAIISLVVVHNNQVLGHILFSPVATTPPSEAKGIGLAQVAVQPHVQSQGIGSKLIPEGLRICRDLGYDYRLVLGSPEYYFQFGFQKASDVGLQNAVWC